MWAAVEASWEAGAASGFAFVFASVSVASVRMRLLGGGLARA